MAAARTLRCSAWLLPWEEPLDYVLPPDCAKATDGLYGESGPCVRFLGHPSPCSMYGIPINGLHREFGPSWVPEEWIDRTRPLSEVFVDAFIEAVRSVSEAREQRVVTLRYGLDGMPGRTFKQIGEDLGRSPSRVRDLLQRPLNKIRLAPVRVAAEWPPKNRACGIVVHVATEVLGDAIDDQAPSRVRAFIDQALPNVRVQSATQLLIELTCLDLDVLRLGRDRALCRAIAAVRRA